MHQRPGAVAAAILLVLTGSQCAPRSSNSKSKTSPTAHTVYDQKQTGDYNIQLHLKDFQVIALLAGEGGALGDYDYAYDYSDFTVKPVTQKPSEPTTTAPSTTAAHTKPDTYSTLKPSNHPYPIVSPSIPSSKPSTSNPPSPGPSTSRSDESTPLQKQPDEEDTNAIPKHNITLTEMLSGDRYKSTTQKTVSDSSTDKNGKLEETMAPGKIKVQIIQTPSIGIVADEDSHEQNEAVPHIEGGAMLRRCASGFTRDKRGRCRRVRKPGTQLPFGFSRFASNLASRFHQPAPETSLSSSSESSEE